MAKGTTADIPDQRGRTAVITGANTGLGFQIAAALAAHGARVVLAVRNLGKGKEALARITAATPGADVELQRLDLSSLASVRAAAGELKAKYDRVDLLINNAGVMFPPRELSEDGFELQFATNHLGHFALKFYAHCIDGQADTATSGSPTPSGCKTPSPSPNPVTREMTTASRHPKMPGQRHKAGRMVGVTAPTAPVRGFSVPVRGPSPVSTDA
jgi:NAD(P)-dependent dehydrogenase (short-subunit alcohol dehydrogenase family)